MTYQFIAPFLARNSGGAMTALVAACGSTPTAAPVIERSPNAEPAAKPVPATPPATAAASKAAELRRHRIHRRRIPCRDPPPANLRDPANPVPTNPAAANPPAAGRTCSVDCEIGKISSTDFGKITCADGGAHHQTLSRRRLAARVPHREERRHALQHRSRLRSGLSRAGGMEQSGRSGIDQDRSTSAPVSAGQRWRGYNGAADAASCPGSDARVLRTEGAQAAVFGTGFRATEYACVKGGYALDFTESAPSQPPIKSPAAHATPLPP